MEKTLLEHWLTFKERFAHVPGQTDPIRREAELKVIRFLAALHDGESDEEKIQGSFISGFNTDFVSMEVEIVVQVPRGPYTGSYNYLHHDDKPYVDHATTIPLIWLEHPDPIHYARGQVLDAKLRHADQQIRTHEAVLARLKVEAESLRTLIEKHKESKNGQDTQTTQVVQGHDPAAGQTG